MKQRVENGGHNIPQDIIERRYKAGIVNLNKLYLNFVDTWMIYDNSNNKHELIAEKMIGEKRQVYNASAFKIIEHEK